MSNILRIPGNLNLLFSTLNTEPGQSWLRSLDATATSANGLASNVDFHLPDDPPSVEASQEQENKKNSDFARRIADADAQFTSTMVISAHANDLGRNIGFLSDEDQILVYRYQNDRTQIDDPNFAKQIEDIYDRWSKTSTILTHADELARRIDFLSDEDQILVREYQSNDRQVRNADFASRIETAYGRLEKILPLVSRADALISNFDLLSDEDQGLVDEYRDNNGQINDADFASRINAAYSRLCETAATGARADFLLRKIDFLPKKDRDLISEYQDEPTKVRNTKFANLINTAYDKWLMTLVAHADILEHNVSLLSSEDQDLVRKYQKDHKQVKNADFASQIETAYDAWVEASSVNK
jgi:hypothetical protein